MTWPDDSHTADPGRRAAAPRPAAPTMLTIDPGGLLRGRLRVPGDKSISHRAFLLGSLADGVTTIEGFARGEDVRHTALAVRALGAVVEMRGDVAVVHGGPGRLHEPDDIIDVGNSGTLLRLLAGLVAGHPWHVVLTGDESIATRPMGRVAEPLRRMGARVDGRAGGTLTPIAVRGGGLHGIDFDMPVASAQVKSAVLLAGLSADGDTVVREPAPCRAHTEEMLAAAGADVTVSPDGASVTVRRSQPRPMAIEVPGDPSQAAFWAVGASILPGSDLVLERVYVGRARAGFLEVLRRMGADIEVTPRDGATADIRVRSALLHGTTVAGEEIPTLVDEIPALAVAAAVAEGPTEFRDAEELTVKETNRIKTITSELRALGARVEPAADGLTVVGSGGKPLAGGGARSFGDHRIAMAAAVAALAAERPTQIEGWDAVATSYPGFEADLANLRP